MAGRPAPNPEHYTRALADIEGGLSRRAAFARMGIGERTIEARMAKESDFADAVHLAEGVREGLFLHRLVTGLDLKGSERWLLATMHAPNYAPKPAVVVQPASSDDRMTPEDMEAIMIERGWTPPKS